MSPRQVLPIHGRRQNSGSGSEAARIVLDTVRRCGVLDVMTPRSADDAGAELHTPAGPTSLGLPANIRALLFDLDGVLTRTSTVHAAAWKEMFDGYLRERAARTGEPFREFDAVEEYARYVDGKPRQEGTKSFLAARGIELPMGAPDDPPSAETVYGLGNRKNEIVHRRIRTDGVDVYDGSVRYLRAARAAGLRTAVVSSSANTRDILLATGLESLFEARVDAQVAVHEHLAGKPAPDTFLHGAAALETPAQDAVVFEDAVAGVEAGRAGGFGLVVGVDRLGQADRLRQHGADIVVSDLEDLLEKAP
jgi:beta-phosphoglucomutase family hydrolase